ncbi:trypsin-like peptidase domain-containing protein [Thiohalocapsa marina]|uniref:trypsin-like peptidase domain-containing protein n=1 Tax=Thiohalocapsa marina TaxID=424902 RepID=UPI0036D7D780
MKRNRQILMGLGLILMMGWGSQAGAQDSAFELGMAAVDRGDYETARQMFAIEAEAGSLAAQVNLGVIYSNGYGVKQNYAEAARWYRMAAEQGDADAQSNLGVMYDKGYGVPQNDADAVRWYRQAAEQGDAGAQYNLGVMLSNGRGITPNVAEAVRWFRMAAEQGDADAQYLLALMYRDGGGVPKDDAEAVRWFRMAAEQGHVGAQNDLGSMYTNGSDVEKNQEVAAQWYRMAADQGQAVAQLNLGMMYLKGVGVERDETVALRWFKMAAEQGLTKAQSILGAIYETGSGVKKNGKEAVRWYQRAAEQGDVDAQTRLGFMYTSGINVEKNDEEAMRWYRMAAEQGDADAQTRLVLMYSSGSGVAKNYQHAADWFQLAAEQGSPISQSMLGSMYAEGLGFPKNYIESYKWFSLAAAQGEEIARSNLEAIESNMTPVQIAEAQRLAAAWRPGDAPSSANVETMPQVSSGATPQTIRSIQRQLEALGFKPGPADGVFGLQTREAIKAFQRKIGIEPDGIPSSTLDALLAAAIEEVEKGTAPVPSRPGVIATGTGFFVNESGQLLTNHHVIDGCTTVKVVLPKGSLPAKLVASNPDDDLAILGIEAVPDAVAPFRRVSARLGEDVLVAGYPLRGLLGDINVTSGEISSTSGVSNDRRYLQISAPVQKGNSGGPLLDRSGAVVGVVVSKLDAVALVDAIGDLPQNINFAVKGAVVRSFLSINDIAFVEVDEQSARDKADLAEEARSHTVPVECWN